MLMLEIFIISVSILPCQNVPNTVHPMKQNSQLTMHQQSNPEDIRSMFLQHVGTRLTDYNTVPYCNINHENYSPVES
jgi:hypothetical protein